jgi:S-formylglutathione hydrolase FrmB
MMALLLTAFFGCGKEKAVPDDEPFVRLVEDKVLESKLLNYQVKYAVLLPEEYETSSDEYPVVYLLHGFGDNHSAWYKGGAIQYYADFYITETGPAIYVMPQGFNSYYVNKFSGTFPYMDMFVQELVPLIDNQFRTKKDPSQRAVMGYSMGGYGALILPALNPDVFEISVPLSMSFRTDDQYMNQSQDGWDFQFGAVFGGNGATGENRLTDYFKLHSPFHFFDKEDLTAFSKLQIFLDCGDDEESLHITNGALHNLLRDRGFEHVYRVRNGDHSWNYWHGALKEAMVFIGNGFKGLPHPKEPLPVNIGELLPEAEYTVEDVQNSSITLGVFKPVSYENTTDSFPVIYYFNDLEGGSREANRQQLFSLLNNKMNSKAIVDALVIEIPVGSYPIDAGLFEDILAQLGSAYRIKENKQNHIIISNGSGCENALDLLTDYQDYFNACFLYSGKISENNYAAPGLYYYIDMTDNADAYKGNYNLFLDMRENNISHEYRVRQGTQSFQAFLNGLDNSMSLINVYLKK